MTKIKQELTAEEKALAEAAAAQAKLKEDADAAQEALDAEVATKKDDIIADDDAGAEDDEDEQVDEVANPFLAKLDETSPVDVTEISAIFEGQAVAEDFKNKFTTLFQAIVTKTVNEIVEAKNSLAAVEWTKRAAQYDEDTLALVSDFLETISESWKEENKVAIQHGIKTKMLDEMIADVRAVFEKHNILLPEDKVDLVAAAQAEAAALKAEVNKLTEAAMADKKAMLEMKKEEAFKSLTEGMADTEVEKLRTLVAGTDAHDIESYKKNVGIIKESAFPKKDPDAEKLLETNKPVNTEIDPTVARAMAYLRPAQD